MPGVQDLLYDGWEQIDVRWGQLVKFISLASVEISDLDSLFRLAGIVWVGRGDLGVQKVVQASMLGLYHVSVKLYD